MGDSKIGWTDKTWPVVSGCKYASPGCLHCCAARDAAARLSHLPRYAGLAVVGVDGEPAAFTGEVRMNEDVLDQPLHWKRPARIFVASQADLFHPKVSDTFTLKVASVMEQCPRHTFQILTKRPVRMATAVGWWWRKLCEDRPTAPLPNGHFGVSVENDEWCQRRQTELRKTWAAVRFISAEPLLGPLPSLDLTGIDQVIVGGESGINRGVRRMDPDWAREILEKCREGVVCELCGGRGWYGVPLLDALGLSPTPGSGRTCLSCNGSGRRQVAFFFKQAGQVLAREWGMSGAGHLKEGSDDYEKVPEDLRVQQYPATRVPAQP